MQPFQNGWHFCHLYLSENSDRSRALSELWRAQLRINCRGSCRAPIVKAQLRPGTTKWRQLCAEIGHQKYEAHATGTQRRDIEAVWRISQIPRFFCHRVLLHLDLSLLADANARFPTSAAGADTELVLSPQVLCRTEEAAERSGRGPNARTRSSMRSIGMRYSVSLSATAMPPGALRATPNAAWWIGDLLGASIFYPAAPPASCRPASPIHSPAPYPVLFDQAKILGRTTRVDFA
jgi:hypothetical protein